MSVRISTNLNEARIAFDVPRRLVVSNAALLGAVAWLIVTPSPTADFRTWLISLCTLPIGFALALPVAYLLMRIRLRVTPARMLLRHPKVGSISIPRGDLERVSFVPDDDSALGHIRFDYSQNWEMSAGGPLAKLHDSLGSVSPISRDDASRINEAIRSVPVARSQGAVVADSSPMILRAVALAVVAAVLMPFASVVVPREIPGALLLQEVTDMAAIALITIGAVL